MKKLHVLTMVVIFCMVFAGCSLLNNSNKGTSDDTIAPEVSVSPDGSNGTENANRADSDKLPKEAYGKYAMYLGTSQDSFFEQYSASSDGYWWIGAEWYNINDETVYSVATYDGYIIAINIALNDAYPRMINHMDKNGKISKESFEKNIIEKETKYVWFPEEFAKPFLEYEKDGLEFQVFCDENGDIDVNTDCVMIGQSN